MKTLFSLLLLGALTLVFCLTGLTAEKKIIIPANGKAQADEDGHQEPFLIVSNNKVHTAIIIPDKAFEVVKYAAKELQYHIKKATGVLLPVIPEREKPNRDSGFIFLGSCRETNSNGIDAGSLGNHGFIIRFAKGNLFMAGNDSKGDPLIGYFNKVQCGTLFAVYEFLQKKMGVRWLWPGTLGEVIPTQKTIAVKNWDQEQKPWLRFSHWRSYPYTPLSWHSEEKHKKFLRDLKIWLKRHRFSQKGYISASHTYTKWWKKYGKGVTKEKQRLQFFNRLPDGSRRPLADDPTGHSISMCVSEPSLWQEIAKSKKAWSIVNLGENDTPGMCTCTQCRAWDSSDPKFAESAYWTKKIKYQDIKRDSVYGPSLSDRYAKFYLAVQKEAQKYRPDVEVCGFAYSNYVDPPRETKLNERVLITMTPKIMFPWTDKKRNRFKNQWQGWRNTGSKLILRPNYTLSGHNFPIFYGRKFIEDFAFAAKRNMLGTDFDSLIGSFGAQGPTLYAIARAHVRPFLGEKILDEYYNAFGDASPEVKAYFAYWENVSNNVTGKNINYQKWFLEADKIFTHDVMQKGRKLLDTAIQKGSGCKPLIKQRLDFLDKGLRHTELTLALVAAYKQYQDKKDIETFQKYRSAIRTLNDFRIRNEHLPLTNYYYLKLLGESWVFDFSLLKTKETDLPLTGKWKFQWDLEENGESKGWHQSNYNDSEWYDIEIDSSWEKQPIGKEWRKKHSYDYDGIAWYRAKFAIDKKAKNKRFVILFGAVDEACVVWVNNKKMLKRTYNPKINPDTWMEPFSIDVTDVVQPGQNTISVRVEDRIGMGGIWKQVWLSQL